MGYKDDDNYDWSDNDDNNQDDDRGKRKKKVNFKMPMDWSRWRKYGQVYWCFEERRDERGRLKDNRSLVRIVQQKNDSYAHVEYPDGYNLRLVHVSSLKPVKKEEEFLDEGMNYI